MKPEPWFGVRYAKALRAHPTLSPRGRLVGLVIATHTDNETGECHLSLDTLETETGYARHTVLLGIKDLEGAGLLESEAPGRHRSNGYRALIPEQCSGDAPLLVESSEGRQDCTGGASQLHSYSAATALKLPSALPEELPTLPSPSISSSDRRRLYKAAKDLGLREPELRAVVLDVTGQESTGDMTVEQLDAVLAALDEREAA